METAIEEIVSSSQLESKKKFYAVRVDFRNPLKRWIVTTCGIFEGLGKVFNRSHYEIKLSIDACRQQGGDGFMQEYLIFDDAALAVSQATCVPIAACCQCLIQEGIFFYIVERTP